MAIVDPHIFIDPSFALASLYSVVLSDGVGNEVPPQFGEPIATPLPAALPLFATGLGVWGLLGWRRKRKAV